jgi:signal transduction histidine kinase
MAHHHEPFLESVRLPDDEISVACPAVLIVDDHPANLIALEAVLGRLAVRIERAHSGEEALILSEKQDFAVILLDWRMPRLDGIETARLMRERDSARQPPVIILTAHLPEPDEIKTAYAAGVVDFLLKPYAAEVLVAKVSVFVELHVQREKLRIYERALRKRFERDLVGIVSHDLRTPLNAISLAAETILRRGETTQSDRRSLQIIQSSAGRASRLVRDLLDYTQVIHGTAPPLRLQKFCLSELVREILEELKASFRSAEFVLEHTGFTEGKWDRDRLAQVIANLVGNASTYGGTAPIVVRVVGGESEVSLHVHNQGEPIPAELVPELFQPLKRGNTGRGVGNIGLGLFIVNEIVRAHGGTISVHSAAEHGTTFSVSLPAVARESEVRVLGVLLSERPPAEQTSASHGQASSLEAQAVRAHTPVPTLRKPTPVGAGI